MADVYHILSGFSYGELDPKLAARVDFTAYNRGVKTASNVLSIPQGGFTGRFGTRYVATLSATNKNYALIYSFVYDDSAVYTLLFEHNTIKIYLEGTLLDTVVTTYPAAIVKKLSFVVVNNRLIILHVNFAPAQLVRSAVAANAITGIDDPNNYITITNALTVDNIYPATFTTAGTLPVTDQQIFINTLYYVRPITATSIRVYSTPEDAAANRDYYNITGAGTGNLILQNTWTLSNIAFSNLPAYDFDYFSIHTAPAFTFTPSATTGTVGTPLRITASGAIFNAEMVGGLFFGNGGIVRITAYPSNLQPNDGLTVDGWTYDAFTGVNAFPGSEAFLGAPAWSATRGYPSCGTYFQERLFLAGARSIPNGVWGSTIFAVYDFDDAQALDDNSITYYAASGQSSYIKSLTSSKSLIVHSSTGNYSTPLSIEIPLTPQTFSLSEQSKDGTSSVVPVHIDNQVIYVDRSANNVKSMMWDIVQSSFVNTNISLTASHLINDPVDMDVFREPAFTDGHYLICVNKDGGLGIYNSLIEQDVKGWTKADTKQNTSNGYFRDLSTGLNRAWVIVERTINGANVLYLEELDFEVKTDCSVRYNLVTPAATLTGLNHLEGETVQIYADGVVKQDEVVAGGAITLNAPVSEAFVGLKFISKITPLPVNIATQNGPSLYQSSHIRRLQVHYQDSVGVQLQGYDIPTIDLQDIILGALPNVITGIDAVNNYLTITDELVIGSIYAVKFTTTGVFPITIPQIEEDITYYIRPITATDVRVYTTHANATGNTNFYNITIAGIGNIIFDDTFGEPSTGVYKYTMMEGWSGFNYEIDIVQEFPLPMTILSIGYNVEVK